jgi:hypothetical protein
MKTRAARYLIFFLNEGEGHPLKVNTYQQLVCILKLKYMRYKNLVVIIAPPPTD